MTKLKCSQCIPTESCGRVHLYVIEMRTDVAKEPKFDTANPDYVCGKRCFYVGSSAHLVDCRFRQHNRFAGPNNIGFECPCFRETKTRYFVNRHAEGRTRGHQFAAYNLGLVFDLPHNDDSVFTIAETVFESNDDAEIAEVALAKFFCVNVDMGFGKINL